MSSEDVSHVEGFESDNVRMARAFGRQIGRMSNLPACANRPNEPLRDARRRVPHAYERLAAW